MNNVANNLLINETIVYQTTSNKSIFIVPLLLIAYGVERALLHHDDFLILGGIVLIISFIYYKTAEFVITNQRVILKTGLLRHKSFEILLNRIESIYVSQSFLGRLCNYGTLTIRGTGGSSEAFSRINSPFVFHRKVQEQLAAMKNA